MTENQIAAVVIDCSFRIHTKIGPGLLETVYETLLEHELIKLGLSVSRQQSVSFEYDGVRFDDGFRMDLLVGNKVVVELKSVEKIAPVHKKQVLTYLRLTGLKLGLLINFGSAYLKDGIARIINGTLDE
ncbi:MAG: GxxExxY protein [Desulfobulbus sp.]